MRYRPALSRGAALLTQLFSSNNKNTMLNAKFQDPKFVPKQVNDYVLRVGFHESSVAEQLRLETAKHERSRTMGDPIEASMFKVLLPAIRAKKVIEVGVFTGYTTLIMAEAIGPDGKIVALDVSEEYTNIGKPYWEQAQVSERIDLIIAPASDSLQELLDKGEEGTYDFAFIDADKGGYKIYYELLLKLLRKDGIIAIDNVLWGGRVLDADINDDDTVALREISNHVHLDNRVEHVMLPFADGVTLVRKK
jgi:predicted O-methyltransferase YrrM